MTRDVIKDGRSLPVFIHSVLDDLPLSLEAFRVYAHIARRAGKDNNAFPSYTSIGKICFRGSYPNAPESTLRVKAIAAVNELLEYGLITKQKGGKGQANTYHLTNPEHWRTPSQIDTCNIRKGRQGLTRKSRQVVNPDNQQVVNPVNQVVNPDNQQVVNPVNQVVNPDNPKVLHLNNSNKGTPCKKGDKENLTESAVNFKTESEPTQASPANVSASLAVQPVKAELVEEDQSSAAAFDPRILSDDILDVLMADAPMPSNVELHPTARMEARFRAGMQGHEWKRDKRALGLFLEYLTNSFGKSYSQEQRRNMAQAMILKANRAAPGSEEYMKVQLRWVSFKSNASQSATVEEATGKNSKLPAGIREMIERRDRERAERNQQRGWGA